MGKVHVQISTGKRFWLDERIQERFPDDYVAVKRRPRNTPETKSGNPDDVGGEK